MRIADYPDQEPLSDFARLYHEECMARGASVLRSGVAREFSYGPNAYQSGLAFPASRPDGRVLAFIHGGGWTNGYKEWMAFMAPAFTANGVTFVSLGYRLAPDHLFPAGVADVAAGIAAALRLVPDLGGHPDRLFLGGHSAGGHYAALVTLDPRWLDEVGLDPGVVRGCLPVSGVYRFGAGSGLSTRPRFLGPEDVRIDRLASPVLAIGSNAPPFLIAWGERDFPHLVAQAREMAEALGDAGAAVQSIEIAGADHLQASQAGGDARGAWVSRALAFMDRPLG